ncbi:ankyrin-1-like [Trichogramma pretiosum]|uniref:ankyrin-1-like n=1 Tax=Trichogramma pretiosum TaxID=7493 RepID=UPI000C719CCA|nr:ankyrin-1-like [Trichogramma pretiosum]
MAVANPLKSLRQNVVDWSIEEHLWAFIHQLDLLIRNWKGDYPNLREIFQPEEIDLLLSAALMFVEGLARSRKNKGAAIIRFVAASGYRDEPEVDESGGRLVLHRTTPVHRAIKRDRYIIERLFDIYNENYIDVESGLSQFHVACRRGLEKIVELFLELGQADPNVLAEKTLDSPLHLAAAGACIGVMRMLPRRGADPGLANVDGSTPMHVICRKGDCDGQAEILLELCRDEYLPLPLDARTSSGEAALHEALTRGHWRMAEFLLKNGADPNLANGAGETGLHIVCRRERGSRCLASKLFEACKDVGRTLDVNAEDSKGWTPLNLALFHGKRKMVELLLKEGADPRRTNSEATTSLHVIASAVAHDFLADQFFQILSESHRPLRVDAQDKLGNTPLHVALANNNRRAAEALLRRQADPNLGNDERYTALHVICKRDKDDGLLRQFFKMIDAVQTTVEVDARDKEGNTPLHLAAAGGSLILVKDVDGGLAAQFFEVALDMDLEVRIDDQDNRGNTPLHLALAAGCCNRYMVQLLLRNQADPNLPNEEGQTPLHLLCSRDDLKENTAFKFF